MTSISLSRRKAGFQITPVVSRPAINSPTVGLPARTTTGPCEFQNPSINKTSGPGNHPALNVSEEGDEKA